MITYVDPEILKTNENFHPALSVDKRSPYAEMTRVLVDGKSVFKFNEEQALRIGRYYLRHRPYATVESIFGDYVSDWTSILGNSYFMEGKGVSAQTIRELVDTEEVTKKLLDEAVKTEDKGVN